ncbi:hypothetical protein [Natronospora cellulosivora (SeqCode)]
MLNRTDILKDLLEIRRLIYKKEISSEINLSKEDQKIRRDLDGLIKAIIGDFFSEEDKEQIEKILLKTICGEIDSDIALIAIKEIVASYYEKEKNNEKDKKEILKNYNSNKNNKTKEILLGNYQNGYR